MTLVDVLIIGGGPSGLSAAIEAATAGARVLLCERASELGGQLIKQTHKFFGSKQQYASSRGFDIANILINEVRGFSNLTVWTDATILGVYEDGVVTCIYGEEYRKIRPDVIIVATGASEKFTVFPGNDLPGVYGAGAVQTLMNLHGVLPAKDVVMAGAGNIGLIVSYQLLQAGVNVKAVFCTGPRIGGYLVHAAKLRRMGVPILTSTLLESANGTDKLESVTLCRADLERKKIEGSSFTIPCDNLCISVGLSPLADLLFQIGCKMKLVPELGGYVPVRNGILQTSHPFVFVAGDLTGVEEASSAMVEGRIAGLAAIDHAGYHKAYYNEKMAEYKAQLAALRSSPESAKLAAAIKSCTVKGFY